MEMYQQILVPGVLEVAGELVQPPALLPIQLPVQSSTRGQGSQRPSGEMCRDLLPGAGPGDSQLDFQLRARRLGARRIIPRCPPTRGPGQGGARPPKDGAANGVHRVPTSFLRKYPLSNRSMPGNTSGWMRVIYLECARRHVLPLESNSVRTTINQRTWARSKRYWPYRITLSLRQESSGKEEETRTLKPFDETLRVQIPPGKAGPAARSESCVAVGRPTLRSVVQPVINISTNNSSRGVLAGNGCRAIRGMATPTDRVTRPSPRSMFRSRTDRGRTGCEVEPDRLVRVESQCATSTGVYLAKTHRGI